MGGVVLALQLGVWVCTNLYVLRGHPLACDKAGDDVGGMGREWEDRRGGRVQRPGVMEM